MKTELMCRISLGGKPLWRIKGVGRCGRGEATGPGRGRAARGPLVRGAAEQGPSRAHTGGPVSGFQHSLHSVTAKEQRGERRGHGRWSRDPQRLPCSQGDGNRSRPQLLPVGRCCSVAQSCPTLVTPGTVARQAPLSMRFPREEYRSGMPFPPPGDLPRPRDRTCVSCPGRQLLYRWATREAPQGMCNVAETTQEVGKQWKFEKHWRTGWNLESDQTLSPGPPPWASASSSVKCRQ